MSIGLITVNGVKESAEKLAEHLGIPWKIVEKGSTCNDFDKVINYGVSRIKTDGEFLMNKPRNIRRSLNKLRTFELLKGHVPMPLLTQDKEVALDWCNSGRTVVCRNRIKGTRGQGVFMTDSPILLEETPAKYWTRFISHVLEIRVNCYQGKVLSVYNKLPVPGDWVFKIQKEYPNQFDEFAAQVHKHIELDFYGLDVLQTKKGNFYVLEVNSAPVLFPITIKRLSKQLQEVL